MRVVLPGAVVVGDVGVDGVIAEVAVGVVDLVQGLEEVPVKETLFVASLTSMLGEQLLLRLEDVWESWNRPPGVVSGRVGRRWRRVRIFCMLLGVAADVLGLLLVDA